MNAIEILNLRFKYPEINSPEIFKGVNFNFEKGNNYWLKGNNGVGKSTLLKLIAGHFPKYKGKISNPYNLKVSLFKNNYGLIPHIKAIELIKFYNLKFDNQKLEELSNDLSFSKYLETKVKNLSEGNKVKLLLINQILLDTDIYLLDEPFLSMDVSSVQYFKDFYSKENSVKNKTILIVSHNEEQPIKNCNEIHLSHI
jgi:ABC-type multidrug transport system ATPase subunit